jgi:hypothetical protein
MGAFSHGEYVAEHHVGVDGHFVIGIDVRAISSGTPFVYLNVLQSYW